MSGKSVKPGLTRNYKLGFEFVGPCVSLSFLVAVGPAYANHADRFGVDFDRGAIRQMRVEQRLERQDARQNDNARPKHLPIQLPMATPQVANDAALRVRHNHVRNLDTAALRNDAKTWQQLGDGGTRNTNGTVELNLASGDKSIILGSNLLGDGGVTVTVGGGEKTFTAGSKVTAAEYASILQVLNGESQSLKLDGQGRAAGGSMTLQSLTNGDRMRVSALVIPEAVNVVGNFGNRSDFHLTGNLVNNGSIIALSNNPNANKASISAHNLTNSSTGLISTVVDASAFPQYGKLQDSVDLRLRADEVLTNQGSITSSGSLTLSARVVNNDSRGNNVANISALNNVSIEANQLNNSGSISAQLGNVGILSNNGVIGPIVVDNAGGRIEALNGSINVGASTVEKVDTTITGGSFVSRELNIDSGDGTLEFHVENVTGAVSAKAGIAHITADSDLFVANLQTSGDPTLKSTGDLTVGNVDTDGGPLALLATGNINFIANAVIDTSSTTVAGGTITAVAGSDWKTAGANNVITGASKGGGSINGTGNAIQFKTDGLTDAGSINLIAFTSSSGAGGDILLDSATISAQGGTNAKNGNVTIIGGGQLVLPAIDARGAASKAGFGDVVISSYQPVVIGGSVIISDATGAILNGTFRSGTANANTFDLAVGDIEAGGDVSISGSDASSIANVDAKSLNVTALSNILLNGSLTAPSGIVLVAGSDIIMPQNGLVSNIVTASSTTNGGDVTIVAGASFTETANSIQVIGASATGGFIGFDNGGIPTNGGNLGLLDTRSTAANGSGGDVSLISYTSATDGFSAVFTSFAKTQIKTGGSGNGANGDFTAIAGDKIDRTAIGIRGSVDTSGGSAVGTGDVYIANATPQGGVTILKNTGAITGGDFRGGSVTFSGGYVDDITVGNGADVTISSGKFLVLTTIKGGTGSTLNVSAASSVEFTGLAGIDVGRTTITGGGFIDFAGSIKSPGGIVLVSGSTIDSTVFGVSLSSDSATTNAGDIIVVAGASFTRNANSVTVTGASATGGRINFDSFDVANITASSSAANGSAGDITLVTFTGSANTGEIFLDSTTTFNVNGKGTGSNGNITMVSGSLLAVGIQSLSDITISGGVAGTGSVSVATAAPVVPVTISTTGGGITSGDFRGGALNKSSINLGNITILGGDIDIASGSNVTAGNLDVSGGASLAGGTIGITTSSTEVLDVGLAGQGANSITSVDASGGSTTGAAGSVHIANNGTGGINLVGFNPLQVTEGDGGDLSLTTLNGPLTIDSATNLNVDAATSTATSHTGGNATIIANTIATTPTAVIPISGAGTAGGANGALVITLNNQALALGTGGDQFDIGSFSSVSLKTNNGKSIAVNAGGGFSTVNASFDSANAVVFSDPVSASDTLDIKAATAVSNSTTITGTKVLNISTQALANTGTINGGVITFEGSSFAMSGAGGQVNATNSTTIVADAGNINLSGSQTFTGPLTINAFNVPGSTVTVLAAANYAGTGPVTVNTYTFNQFGTLTGNPLTVNTTFYNIVNNNGNVALTSDLIYTGKNLAIIASGSVFAAGATNIDLSSTTADGGSLLILAGYNFTPGTASQQTNGSTITVTGTSGNNGNIDLSGVAIDLSSTSGNGGKLTAIASAGSIKLGSVDTTASAGLGGAVQLIGEFGVQVGNIDTQASGADGAVSIAAAKANIVGSIVVTNGTQQAGGSFVTSTLTGGDVKVSNINAPDANVSISGAVQLNDVMQSGVGTAINAQKLTLTTGSGQADLNTNVNQLQVDGAGPVNIMQAAKDLTITQATGASLSLSVDSAARIFVNAGSIANISNLTLLATAGSGVDGITLGSPISVSSDLVLAVQGGGDLTINQALTAGDDITLSSLSGNLAVGANVSAGDTATLAAGKNLSISSALTAPNAISLTSGDDLLASDITGSIGTTAVLTLQSIGGAVGTSLNPFITDAAAITIAAGKSAFVQSSRLAGVALDSGAAQGQFVFTAAGPIAINGNVATTSTLSGDILITQNGKGTLSVADGVSITSTEGDIVINNNDIDKKTGFIKIGNNILIKGSGTAAGVGDVAIVLGGVPVTPVVGKIKTSTKRNVVVNETGSGQVFAGSKSINIKKQTDITLQALNRNLVFSTGAKQSKKNLSLGSNVSITADPPGDVLSATGLMKGIK